MPLGATSDRLGRRPLPLAALLLAAASTAIFWTADGVLSLVIARAVQGGATGTAISGLTAGLVDFSPARHPQAGTTVTAVGTSGRLAAGAAVVGLLVQSVPHPDTDVFSVLTRVFLILTVAIWLIPETVASPVGAPSPSVPGRGPPRIPGAGFWPPYPPSWRAGPSQGCSSRSPPQWSPASCTSPTEPRADSTSPRCSWPAAWAADAPPTTRCGRPRCWARSS
ncbi:MFS transporter [Streptomyces sp. NBC_00117]|uniref:MFS transporter n=1 Tax=Streptomyces sp. NBC_00117 TaxID=2975657 RepID=UPI00386FA4DE